MKKLILFSVMLASVFLSACSKKPDPVSKTDFMLDTECTVTIYDYDKEKISESSSMEDIINQSFELCKKYESMFSRTLPESDISMINAAKGESVVVNDETANLLQLSKDINQKTDGYFDITVGRLTSLWDFKNERVPSEIEIKSALDTVGNENITLLKTFVRLENSDTQLDLGGIAKGYIGDKMKEYLISQGITSAIIDLGGNIVILGEKDENTHFTIGVKMPFSDENDILRKLKVSDKSVVTSGIYERYFIKDGKKYSHIINPKTGYPTQSDLAGVTIISDKSVTGDAYSTACILLGSEKALELVEHTEGMEAILVLRDNSVILSSGLTEDEEGVIYLK